MLQDPNVERYIEIAVKPLKKEIEQMKAQIEVLNQTLRINDVAGQSEQLVICKKCGSSEMYQYTKTKDKCEECGNIQDY